MATIHLAIDTETGLTLPSGTIKGLSESLQGLRDAGFATDPYTGNRLTTVDDAASGWDNDVQPGWRLLTRTSATVYTMGATIPPTDLDDLKDAWRAFQHQVVSWSAELIHRGVSQKPDKVTQGHERLRHSLGAMYLICRNSTHSSANRKIWATNMRTGALQIRSVDDFYTTDTTQFPPSAEGSYGVHGVNSRWYCWVDISSPATKLLLNNSVYVEGNIPTSVNLLDPTLANAITS